MCRLTPDELDACRLQGERANRMELCTGCGTPFEDAPRSGGQWEALQQEVARDLDRKGGRFPRFFDGRCERCRPR